MKNITFVLFLFSATFVQAQNMITVQVENLKNDKGVCRACLFKDAKAFPNDMDKAICKSTKISATKATFIFENVSTGTYAISVFHDENNNNTLDANMLGIPKEGYGASKNVLPKMSKPSFEDNAFKMSNQDITLTVRIRN